MDSGSDEVHSSILLDHFREIVIGFWYYFAMSFRVFNIFSMLLVCMGLAQVGSAAQSEPRFFRLEFNGRTSYILGSDHGLALSTFPIEVQKALQDSETVIFEANPEGSKQTLLDLDQLRAGHRHVLRNVNFRAGWTFWRLLNSSPQYRNYRDLHPGPALVFARWAYRRQLSDKMESFATEAMRPDRAGRVEADSVMLDPGLLAAAREMVPLLGIDSGQSTERLNAFLLRQAHRFFEHAEFATLPNNHEGMDVQIYRRAVDLRKKTQFLERVEPFKNFVAAYQGLVSPEDLNRALLEMRQGLRRDGKTVFWNQIAANYLFQIIDENYNSLSIDKLRHLHDLIQPSTKDPDFLRDGRFAAYSRERHEYWVRSLVQNIQQGGAFIVVGASHLLGYSQDVEKSLLTEFRKASINVALVNVELQYHLPFGPAGRIRCSQAHIKR